MNKIRLFKLLAIITAIYAFAGFFGVPYAIKNILPQKISEATEGGRFSVQKASFNPFTFRLKLHGMKFNTPQDRPFFSMNYFTVNLNPIDYLWRWGWVVNEIKFYGPKFTIERNGEGEFNYAWLLNLKSEEKEEEDKKPLALMIDRFVFKEGSLSYDDAYEGKAYHVDAGPIGFLLENIDLRDVSEAEGAMRLYATIKDGGFIDIRGKIDSMAPFAMNGSIAFDSGRLYTLWKYFREKFPIEVADGRVAFGFDYQINADDLNQTKLSKLHFDLDRLRLISKDDSRNLFKIDALSLKEGEVFPLRKEFFTKGLSTEGMELSASRSKDGRIDWIDYIEQIQKAFPEDENETKEPWKIAIDGISAKIDKIQWRDDAPKRGYAVDLSALELNIPAFYSDEDKPLTIDITTGGIKAQATQDGTTIASIDKMGIRNIALDRSGKHAQVDSIEIERPMSGLKRYRSGELDLMDYLYAGEKSKETPKEKSVWSYDIERFALKDAAVSFMDEVPSNRARFDLEHLNLTVQGISNEPSKAIALQADTLINKRGSLDLKMSLKRQNMDAEGSFKLAKVPLVMVNPYIEKATYAQPQRGDINVEGKFRYGASKADVSGKVALNDWVVNDSRDGSVLLGWDKIGVTPFVYAYPANRLKINQLGINGFYANTLIDEKKVLNFSTLSRSQVKEEKAPVKTTKSEPFGIDILKLTLHDSSATFSDLSLPLPFKTYIHDLEGSVVGISTTKDTITYVNLAGGVDQYGLAKIGGSLNTKAPKEATDLKLKFENLELKQYTPYSLQFLGYKIADGKLYLDLGYKIDQGKLDSQNRVVIKQIELGAEKEGGSPWPMRLVVALLEDSDGIIDIDLPVVGDVNKPDFKYGTVVWQVIKNILTKAVTSPFRLIGSMLGIDADKLSAIEFDPGSKVILPPEKQKLDQVVSVLVKRPKLMLNIYGGSDSVEDVHAMKGQKLLAEIMKRYKDAKLDSVHSITLDTAEELAEEKLNKKELKALKASLEEKYPQESAFAKHYFSALIEKLIALQSVSPEELENLASQRSAAIAAYLKQTPGLDQKINIQGNEKVKTVESGRIPLRLEVSVSKK